MERPDIITNRFNVMQGGREIQCRLDAPKEPRDGAALILTLAAGADETLDDEAFSQPALPFLRAGHMAVSFDLPCHGARTGEGYGEGIAGFCEMYARGEDVFGDIARECGAVLDACADMGAAHPGRIAVCGCSRGGYLALRALAADSRIACASAICPVTGWEHLREFAAHKAERRLLDMRLDNFAQPMAGRPVYMVMGGHDDRVSTESCLRFYLALSDHNEEAGYGRSMSNLVVTEDVGHSILFSSRMRCGEFLLDAIEKGGAV